MDINAANLNALTVAVKTAFNTGFEAPETQWSKVATKVPSTTGHNVYPWLGKNTQIREWLGDRVIQRLKGHKFAIENKKFEGTIGIPEDDIEDDQYGVYMPLYEQMGQDAKTHPDTLVFAMLAAGFTELCYDGQNFFDTDHPVGNEENGVDVVSNMQDGAGNPWFLLDTRRAIKPLIYQERRKFRLVPKTDPKNSDHVFFNGEFVFGVDGRCNAGFALWQLAFASKATLDEANYNSATQAMMEFTNDAGDPLGVTPTILVVGPSNRAAARELIEVARRANGSDNPNYKAVELVVCPWLK